MLFATFNPHLIVIAMDNPENPQSPPQSHSVQPSRKGWFAWMKQPTVAVVRLEGVLAARPGRFHLNLQNTRTRLEKAFATPKLKAVVLIINSPGGSPAQSELIGRAIRTLADKRKVPVHAFVEDVAASGGYWIAAAADSIHVLPTSIVGSIGVISSGFGLHDFIEKWGIERRVHTSGKSKSLLDPFQPEKTEDVERLKHIQNELHEVFIAWVTERRGERLKAEDSETNFDGSFWLGEEATQRGMADGIADATTFIRTTYGEKMRVKRFDPKNSWLAGWQSTAIATAIDHAIQRTQSDTYFARYGMNG